MEQRNRIALRCAVVCCLWTVSTLGRGDEPAEAFLQALRDRGHYDLAEAYLEQMQDSPLVSESFRKTIPFERAETIIQSTAQLRDINQWEARLADAEALLQQYQDQADTPSIKAKAIESLANLRYRQARVFLSRAENDRLMADERAGHLSRARQLMAESIEGFEQAREGLRVLIEELTQAGDTSADARRQLEPMRVTYTQVRLRIPIVRENLADTYPADAIERRDQLTAALSEFLDLWDKYHRYRAGVDAGLYAARCQKKLGKVDEALAMLEEMFELRDDAALRPVKREAALIAIDCWREKSPYPANAVVQRLEPLVASLGRNEVGQPAWQKLQLELAYAFDQLGAQMEKDGQGTPSEVSATRRRAVALARAIARAPGPYRDDARTMLNGWNASLSEDPGEQAEITTFVAARDKLLETVVDAESAYRSLLEAEQTGQANTEALRNELAAAVARSLEHVQLALQMTTTETDRRDLNHVRYLQAYCYYMIERYYEVAVITQFMLDKYSGVEYSRQAAGLLVNCFARLYEASDEQNKEFARQRLQQAALRVTELYAGSPEADSAAGVLARLAIQQRDLAEAQAHLQRMSNSGSGRSQVGLQLGQQLWLEYRSFRSKLTADESQARQAEIDAQLSDARAVLAESLAGITSADVTFEAALSALFLAAAHMESGDLANAVMQLEEAPVAPLDLIKQRHPAVFESPRKDQFLREAYRTALNVYLANLRTGNAPQTWLDKSQAVLDALRQQLESQEGVDVAREMASIYGLLAMELREQFAGLKQPAERENMAQHLAQFLGNLERQTGDARTLTWISATLLETADTLRKSQAVAPTTSSTVEALYRQAFETLTRAEQKGFADDPQRDARELELQRAKALALRGLGQFEQAVKVFAAVLEKRPTIVPIQLEAAQTLKEWGAATRNANTYGMAMMGTEPRSDPNNARSRRNVIWGYRQLVLALRDKENLREQFYEAYYHLIDSRLEYGVLAPSAEAVKSAQTELENLRSRDAALGGPAWKSQFENLEVRIKEQIK